MKYRVQTPFGWFRSQRVIGAAALATIGEGDRAMHELVRAADNGLPNYTAFSRDPHFEPLRNEPEFKKLMVGLEAMRRAFLSEFGGHGS